VAATAPVVGHAGTHRVGAVAADEPPVLVGDHRSKLDACEAIGAANNQDCVGRQRALLHRGNGNWHAGFQTPRSVIPLKKKGSQGSRIDVEPKPTPRFRQACPTAGNFRKTCGSTTSRLGPGALLFLWLCPNKRISFNLKLRHYLLLAFIDLPISPT